MECHPSAMCKSWNLLAKTGMLPNHLFGILNVVIHNNNLFHTFVSLTTVNHKEQSAWKQAIKNVNLLYISLGFRVSANNCSGYMILISRATQKK